MKHISLFLALITVAFLFTACSEDEMNPSSSELGRSKLKDIVFQERNSKLPNVKTLPLVLYDGYQTRSVGPNGAIIGNSDALLGYSYMVGNSILGDYRNVGFPIIDVNKVKAYDPTCITAKEIKTATDESFSYSNFENYLSKSQLIKKTSSGFSINILKIFRIGRKHKTTKIFSSYLRDSIHSVYGELNIALNNSEFKLLSTQASFHTYTQGFLTKSFVKNIYGSTAGNILNQYGDFLLSGYITGGKATALFAGYSQSDVRIDSKEKLMDQSISSYLNWKTKKTSGKISLDSLNIGNNNGNIKARDRYLNSTYACIYTYGGKGGLTVLDKPFNMDSTSINLTPWAQSLDDENTHTLISVDDNGLMPISSVILEDNFKKRFDYTSIGILSKESQLANPYIEIARYYVRYSTYYNKPLYNIAAILNTRQGDKIILCDRPAVALADSDLINNENNDYFLKKASEIAKQAEKYFEIKIKTNIYAHYNPTICNPLCELLVCNGNDLHWCQDKNSGIYYIYDKSNKIAFSIYVDDIDGDYILDDYGIRDWLDANCTESYLNTGTITRTYKIIGL